ncbi:MAG: ISL3 family transposase [Dissulfurispiraceae bacterium]
MQDKALFSQLLGLQEPWRVTEVKLELEAESVHVYVEWPVEQKAPCPECGTEGPIYDHREERTWRHMDTMQYKTIVHCRTPRIDCPEHGVKSINVPWANKRSRFTALFERLAIDILQGCQCVTKAMAILHLSWDEVHHIRQRAVERGLSRRTMAPKHLGIDEKGFHKGQSYVTMLYDLDNSRVLDVANGRKEEDIQGILLRLSDEERPGVKAVAMDMWEPFRRAVEKLLPQADIVHDRFHIMKYLTDAVDRVRRSENKALQHEGNSSLSGTRFLWLKRPDNWTDDQKDSFRDLKGNGLKVSRAWAIKELFDKLYGYVYEKSARTFFNRWYFWGTHCRLKPVIEVAKMIKRHLANILTYLRHHITNAVAEGINSKIQQVKSAARGFRNLENYRVAILFYCGRLDVYPQ